MLFPFSPTLEEGTGEPRLAAEGVYFKAGPEGSSHAETFLLRAPPAGDEAVSIPGYVRGCGPEGKPSAACLIPFWWALAADDKDPEAVELREQVLHFFAPLAATAVAHNRAEAVPEPARKAARAGRVELVVPVLTNAGEIGEATAVFGRVR